MAFVAWGVALLVWVVSLILFLVLESYLRRKKVKGTCGRKEELINNVSVINFTYITLLGGAVGVLPTFFCYAAWKHCLLRGIVLFGWFVFVFILLVRCFKDLYDKEKDVSFTIIVTFNGIKKDVSIKKKAAVFLSLIVTYLCWMTIPIKYCQNIETSTQSVLEGREERKLISFNCNQLEEIVGSLSADFTEVKKIVPGDSWDACFFDYRYMDESGEEKLDSALACCSTIILEEDDEMICYVEVIKHTIIKIQTDHNTDRQRIITGEDVDYIFHLPIEILTKR